MSFLYLLHEIKLLGGILSLTSVKEGLQEYKIVGGSGQISDRLAEKLEGQVKTQQHVTAISEIVDGVEVLTDTGLTYQAKKAVVCVPLPANQLIKYTPPLPNYMQELIDVKPACQCIKTFTFYSSTFWRDNGLNGELISDDGIIMYAVDDTKPDGSYPMIMGFINAEKALRYSDLSMDERRAMITAQYAKQYNMEQFLHPVYYYEKYWQSEEEQSFSLGCCVWSLPPQVITKTRRLVSPKVPHGNCYFASTETALTMRGYMDGALRSAHCAAYQVAKSLGKDIAYNENEYSESIPYRPLPLIQRWLPTVPVFLVLASFAVITLIICVVLAIYYGYKSFHS